MSSFLQSCVERYQELVPKRVNLRRVDTPYLEDTETAETEEPRGELQPIASRILMKVAHTARMPIRLAPAVLLLGYPHHEMGNQLRQDFA